MKATEQYFPVVLFIMLYKVVLTSESLDEILWCDHSNESFWAVLSCGTVVYDVQGGSTFWDSGWNPLVLPFKWKLLSSTLQWYRLLCSTRQLYLLSLWKISYSVTTRLKLKLSAIIFTGYLTSQHFTFQNLLFSLSFETMRFNMKNLTVMPVFTSHLPHLQLWSCSSPHPWVASLGFQPADWPGVAKFPVYPFSVIFSSATDSSHPMKWTSTWVQ